MADLNVVDLIIAKREGKALEPDMIHGLIAAYTRGYVPDYQMSAFLMAAFLRGMDPAETFALTDAMLQSGIKIDLSGIRRPKVGKHSTGGVGDKVSLMLGPVVAACGVPVAKVSGRGLGFTGGTLDKLESIPGYRTNLSIEEYRRQIDEIGLVLTGQTDDLAPADRALYALRDVTGTVDFIPFIASSIMSKKLAEGIEALVLDVKCGRGAFMKDEQGARELAETLVDIGERFGVRTVAWMTRMDAPLGRAVGNWPEVEEAIRCLQGAEVEDLLELVVALAGEMIQLGGKAETLDESRSIAQEALATGRAFDKFVQLVKRQGGRMDDLNARLDNPPSPAGYVEAPATGMVADVDALAIGQAAVAMGAGRLRKEDAVDPLAGIVLNKKPGDHVRQGEPIARLYTERRNALDDFSASVAAAFTIQPNRAEQDHASNLAERDHASNRAEGDDASKERKGNSAEYSTPFQTSVLIDRYGQGRWSTG